MRVSDVQSDPWMSRDTQLHEKGRERGLLCGWGWTLYTKIRTCLAFQAKDFSHLPSHVGLTWTVGSEKVMVMCSLDQGAAPGADLPAPLWSWQRGCSPDQPCPVQDGLFCWTFQGPRWLGKIFRLKAGQTMASMSDTCLVACLVLSTAWDITDLLPAASTDIIWAYGEEIKERKAQWFSSVLYSQYFTSDTRCGVFCPCTKQFSSSLWTLTGCPTI